MVDRQAAAAPNVPQAAPVAAAAPPKTAPDCKFVAYIKDLKIMYDDGQADYTAQLLMHLADNKYEAYVQSRKWGQPSKEQAEIVALNTKIDVLQKQLSGAKQSSNQRKTTKKEEAKPKTKGKTDTTKKSGKPPKKKGKSNDKFAWKLVAPMGSEVKVDGFPSKSVDKKVYYWCRNHKEGKGKWVLHHPGQC